MASGLRTWTLAALAAGAAVVAGVVEMGGKDDGSPEEIAEIRKASHELLLEWAAVQQIGVPVKDVAPRLRAVFTNRAVDAEIRMITDALRDQRRHVRELVSFTDVRIRVDEWRGVRGAGDRATAILKGTQGLLFPDGWDEREYVWRVDLRDEGGWKIDRLTYDDLQL